ncbi:PD-(D/E)XK nuclease family protein [Helicobacter canadensis]|uniref:PD-(D/E)XK endonuclease-like domain-containing protein n=1 Tax=Helicobacter canadensis MIT 98-5491 TaxID=537970 RepID=C5ZW37_9HELI|nr:PD-(D/E)XK nuclease family protein [Helicobacter canadensis]EES89137.1 conserved hypothetical protein [Helicobacter canadensis MIT 98-5491]EFR47917.1 hypothetical protein HCMG_00090 [Helicobacter canadensis MIT 98-5491]STO99170.1 exonuclease [Helicobacter canadensis]
MAKLYLFSNTRAIKAFFERDYLASFLPDAQSIGEFLEFVLRVEGKSKIPSFLRHIYLYQSIQESNSKEFGEFAKNFSQFLNNSDFFFKFYEELCAGCVRLEMLEKLDIYAFYDDYLRVLKRIFELYSKKLAENHFFDQYFLEDYKITFEILGIYESIEVYLEGFLSHFEMRIFQEISLQKPILLKIFINPFNIEYYQKLFGLSLENGKFTLKLENKRLEILSFESKIEIPNNLKLLEFDSKISEVGGIFTQIDLWLESGISPEEICIILPNEEFAKYLQLFDKARNFNFAMGKKLQETSFFKRLQSLAESAQSFEEFWQFIEEMQENTWEDKEVKKIILQRLEYFSFGLKFLDSLQTRDKIYAFFMMLKKETIDDIGGGRISVIGILETRGIAFSYVILPEFNQNNVPKVSQKDIFLNSIIRQKVGLPTRKDRENLQKYYYAKLFAHSKEACVMFVSNEEEEPSRFLLEEKIFKNASFAKASRKYGEYFLNGELLSYKEKEIIAPLDFGVMSATKLECLLTCKRKYYYRYVLGYKEQMDFNVGTQIHKALQKAYVNFAIHRDFEKLQQEAYENLQVYENKREYFELEIAKRYLQKFFYAERKHLEDGWIPIEFEKEFSLQVCEIPFRGRIDRIDKKGESVLVLDYKYKKNLKVSTQRSIDTSKDFQLVLYALALQESYSEVEAGFYDIYEASIKKEEILQEKKQKLLEKLEELKEFKKEFSFELCKERAPCNFCEFIYLCKRY